MRHTTERHPLSKHKNASPGSAYFTRKPNNNTEKRGSNKNSGGEQKRSMKRHGCSSQGRYVGNGASVVPGPTDGVRPDVDSDRRSANSSAVRLPRAPPVRARKNKKRRIVKTGQMVATHMTKNNKNGQMSATHSKAKTGKTGQMSATESNRQKRTALGDPPIPPPKKIVEMLATHSQKIIGWRPNQNNSCMHV